MFLGFFSGLTIGGWLVWACEWDRILACIGTTGIPAAGRTKTGIGAPGKSGRAAFAFLAQGLRSETSPKKWVLIFCLCMVGNVPARGARGRARAEPKPKQPSDTTNRVPEGCGQPISSEPVPVASALGIRWGATPGGPSIPTTGATRAPRRLQRQAVLAVRLHD